MRYLQGTKDYKLTYIHNNQLEVIVYSDSIFSKCVDTRKSTSGYIFLLSEGAISWRSTKQTLVASSIMEAKFVACYKATTKPLWLRNFITSLNIVDSILRPIKIFCDNSASVFFSKNNKIGSPSKHIGIKYLNFRENVKKENVSIKHITTKLIVRCCVSHLFFFKGSFVFSNLFNFISM